MRESCFQERILLLTFISIILTNIKDPIKICVSLILCYQYEGSNNAVQVSALVCSIFVQICGVCILISSCAVNRAQTLAPPGFSMPSRDPPPGFSNGDRTGCLPRPSSGSCLDSLSPPQWQCYSPSSLMFGKYLLSFV